jgi:hypothetical protein
MADDKFLAITNRIAAVRQLYASSVSQYGNFLIYGDFGTGKTTLATTCPRPVFIDCFDPGGTKTRALQPLIDSGDIIVDAQWQGDSWRDPYAYMEWEKAMEDRQREGLWDYIGTYMLDSITRWADSMMWEILRRGTPGKGTRKGKNPELQDYGVQQLTAIDWLGQFMSLPCHVVVTGHIGLVKDEVTGGFETGLLLAGKLSEKVPNVFDEKYITWAKDSPKGVEYKLQTKNDGRYKAETRMGGDLFQLYEPPDIRALLKRAGKSWEDKPSLVQA